MREENAIKKEENKEIFEATACVTLAKTLQGKRDNEVVLVNSNWINGLIPVAARSIKEENKRLEIMSKLHRAIDRLEGERDIYVPMYVDEVRICAGNRKEFPINTFRKASEKDKKRLRKRV